MKMQIEIGGQTYVVAIDEAFSIAIPLDFDGPQPSHFGAPKATRQPMTGDGFTGRVNDGTGCNVDVLTINPHCNGTHTETAGHIVDEPVVVSDAATNSFFTACLISVLPERGIATTEVYRPPLNKSDGVITKAIVEKAIQPFLNADERTINAVVIRTLPNDYDKRDRDHEKEVQPSFLSVPATEYLNELGIVHLLIDMPSIDRMLDEGRLTNHHIFWNVAEETSKLTEQCWTEKTITEMVFVPDQLEDGLYLLNLQVPAFCSDAAPSKPVLFPMKRVLEDD